MVRVPHTPHHISEVLVGQACRVGKRGDERADHFRIGIIFLEFNPGSFRGKFQQIANQRQNTRIGNIRVHFFFPFTARFLAKPTVIRV